MSQANLKIVENTLKGLAEKENEKDKGKRKDNPVDKHKEKQEEKGLKSGDRLKGNKME